VGGRGPTPATARALSPATSTWSGGVAKPASWLRLRPPSPTAPTRRTTDECLVHQLPVRLHSPHHRLPAPAALPRACPRDDHLGLLDARGPDAAHGSDRAHPVRAGGCGHGAGRRNR